MTRDDQRRAAQDHGVVVLPCDELAPTIAFFVERLGFRVDRIAPADDPRAAELSGHGLRLQLRRGHDGQQPTLRLPADAVLAVSGTPDAQATPKASDASDTPDTSDASDASDTPATPDVPATPDGLQASSGDPGVAPPPANAGPRVLTAPNGTRVELVERASSPADEPLLAAALPTAPVVDRGDAPDAWVTGRAGMRYRDLIPGRAGGQLIASRIQIPDGGPVPDSVHHHAVRAQVIYCVAGWVRVVYEDQGPPFVLSPGDLVLQPPGIRHRVLEASDGLEVLECASPAEHDTWFDHALELPTGLLRPDHLFGGQHFVRHLAAQATWERCPISGLAMRDLGVGPATDARASARVLSGASHDLRGAALTPRDGLVFLHVLAGSVNIGSGADALSLGSRDSLLVPPGAAATPGAASDDLELFELRLSVDG